MRDIVEVSKVNKDEDWMDSLLIKLLYFFSPSVVPSRPCQLRKQEKIGCRCFSITRHK